MKKIANVQASTITLLNIVTMRRVSCLVLALMMAGCRSVDGFAPRQFTKVRNSDTVGPPTGTHTRPGHATHPHVQATD